MLASLANLEPLLYVFIYGGGVPFAHVEGFDWRHSLCTRRRAARLFFVFLILVAIIILDGYLFSLGIHFLPED